VSKKISLQETQEICEIDEFQLALCTMRTAAQFVMSWNFELTAMEGFLISSKYCKEDIGSLENKLSF
jgi:hypothetical protein